MTVVRYNLLPLKKWHASRVGGQGSLESEGPFPLGWGVTKQHRPWCKRGAPRAAYSTRFSGAGGLGGTRSGASLVPSQAQKGCRGCSGEAWDHTTLSSSTLLKLVGLERRQVKQSCGLHFSLQPRKKAHRVPHGRERRLLPPGDHGEHEQRGPFH